MFFFGHLCSRSVHCHHLINSWFINTLAGAHSSTHRTRIHTRFLCFTVIIFFYSSPLSSILQMATQTSLMCAWECLYPFLALTIGAQLSSSGALCRNFQCHHHQYFCVCFVDAASCQTQILHSRPSPSSSSVGKYFFNLIQPTFVVHHRHLFVVKIH